MFLKIEKIKNLDPRKTHVGPTRPMRARNPRNLVHSYFIFIIVFLLFFESQGRIGDLIPDYTKGCYNE